MLCPIRSSFMEGRASVGMVRAQISTLLLPSWQPGASCQGHFAIPRACPCRCCPRRGCLRNRTSSLMLSVERLPVGVVWLPRWMSVCRAWVSCVLSCRWEQCAGHAQGSLLRGSLHCWPGQGSSSPACLPCGALQGGTGTLHRKALPGPVWSAHDHGYWGKPSVSNFLRNSLNLF